MYFNDLEIEMNPLMLVFKGKGNVKPDKALSVLDEEDRHKIHQRNNCRTQDLNALINAQNASPFSSSVLLFGCFHNWYSVFTF